MPGRMWPGILLLAAFATLGVATRGGLLPGDTAIRALVSSRGRACGAAISAS